MVLNYFKNKLINRNKECEAFASGRFAAINGYAFFCVRSALTEKRRETIRSKRCALSLLSGQRGMISTIIFGNFEF